MKSAMLLVVLYMAAAAPGVLLATRVVYEETMPAHLEVWEQPLEAVYYRARRQVTVGAELPSTGGTRLSAQGTGTVWRGEDSRVDANAHWARTFGGAGGPPTYGGGLTYEHQRGGVGVDVSRTPGFGTQVGVEGRANLWRSNDGRSSLDAGAGWSRNYGGPWGTSRPNYGANIGFTHRF